MFDILVADSLASEGLAILKSQPDVKLTVQEKWQPGELAKVLGNYDGVIIRSGVQIKAPEFAKPGKLKAIARAGVGVDNVDVEAATKAGVLVMNTPDANTVTTAEHALALMMALSRKIPAADASLRAGKWDRKSFMGTQLAGQDPGRSSALAASAGPWPSGPGPGNEGGRPRSLLLRRNGAGRTGQNDQGSRCPAAAVRLHHRPRARRQNQGADQRRAHRQVQEGRALHQRRARRDHR